MIIGSERRVGESLSQVTLMTESTHNDIQPNTTARRVWGTPKYRDTVSDKGKYHDTARKSRPYRDTEKSSLQIYITFLTPVQH